MIVDSHVNLHSDQYEDDLDEVITAASVAGVKFMLTISDKLASAPAIKAIADAHDFIWRSIGVHPHYAKDHADLTAAALIDFAGDPKIAGIGECGLDFHYEYSDREAQLPVFRAHIDAARETRLPLIIHTRNADDDMKDLLVAEHGKGAFTPLLHCYTGGPELAEAVLALGGYISFSGIITFKNASDIRDIVVNTPLDRIIVETDCPYLAPVPMRGRRNEPAFVVHVVEKLAEIKGISIEDAAKATTDNFFRLFSRVHDPRVEQ
jgi:TatD DNase family protein